MKLQDMEGEGIALGAPAEREDLGQRAVKGVRSTGGEWNCGFRHEGGRELEKELK